MYQAKHPAAFINVIAEDGTKAEAVEWLQRTWDDAQELRAALVDAVSVIQTWHNMEIPAAERSSLWDIYWRNAPEIKRIRSALGKRDE